MSRFFSEYLEEMTSCGGGTTSGDVATFSRPLGGSFLFHRNYPNTITFKDIDNYFKKKRKKRY